MMKPRLTCLCILLFCVYSLKAQTNNEKELAGYMSEQRSLLQKAYNNRDIKTYEALLPGFIANYNKLTADQKMIFRGNYFDAYYNLSCIYSLINEKQQALNYLEKSIKAGFYDYAHLLTDTDLDNIRNEERFKTQLQISREVSDYPYILRKGVKYNLDDQREVPKFTYQPSDDPHLVSLRKAFNLDSIAGTGNEVSKIINLLHWVHYLIPHDGNSANPEVLNAMGMIAVCKKEGRGLTCRGLATVLNECYLSLGIKSRFVTCLPKDSLGIDVDCHVINMVYANSLKKWIWIDPTNDAYIMNEKGELLGIEEVRERVINGKPLIVNPDANWNRRQSTLKKNYLYSYMAKNLYILECPVNSEYDAETREQGKKISYITLLPLDYFKQSPDKTEDTNTKNGTTFIRYKTNNPIAFWQTPDADSNTKTK